MAPYGVVGTLFARGTINSAALIALLEGGVFSQLPGLRVVVTAHAIGGLAMAVGLSSQSRAAPAALDLLRKHVFIDTQLIHPSLIKASAELLGSDRVMAGSDWPIVDDGPIRSRLTEAMQHANLRTMSSALSPLAIVSGCWGLARCRNGPCSERAAAGGCPPIDDETGSRG
jgi:hypothetical protein